MKVTLNYLSGRAIDIAPTAHVVASVVRDESLRLPYLLSYYRGIGFDHFIIIDNGSTDGTREFLLGQPDVFLFGADESFAATGFGMAWINAALDKLCGGRWVLLADADELLIWPGCETENIRQFTARLDSLKAEGLFAILLDMYSDKPFGKIGYTASASFVERCPFFDRGPYQVSQVPLFPPRQIYGGVRARIFLEMADVTFHAPTASKLPLLRWRSGQRFTLVAHALANPLAIAPMRGALMHFKMFDDLPEKCRVEVARGEHFSGAREYKVLGEAIERSPGRCFFDPRVSVRYADARQLVALGLMNATHAFEF